MQFFPAAAPVYDSCLAIKQADVTAASGPYWVLLGAQSVQVYCDMDTDGGGWMLVLNYVRSAGTNPTPLVRELADGFPMLGSVVQGPDESQSWGYGGTWGHVSNAALTAVSLCTAII